MQPSINEIVGEIARGRAREAARFAIGDAPIPDHHPDRASPLKTACEALALAAFIAFVGLLSI